MGEIFNVAYRDPATGKAEEASGPFQGYPEDWDKRRPADQEKWKHNLAVNWGMHSSSEVLAFWTCEEGQESLTRPGAAVNAFTPPQGPERRFRAFSNDKRGLAGYNDQLEERANDAKMSRIQPSNEPDRTALDRALRIVLMGSMRDWTFPEIEEALLSALSIVKDTYQDAALIHKGFYE